MRTRHLVMMALLVLMPAAGLAGELSCPRGTTPNGERTPEVSEAWCETMRDGRVVFHGPYRAWWPNGQLINIRYSRSVPLRQSGRRLEGLVSRREAAGRGVVRR